jgi:flagellar biosynthesis chaperone FliJ
MMPYDKKICDEYVNCQTNIKALKMYRKDYVKALLCLQSVCLYPLVTPVERVIKALQRKIETYDLEIIKINKDVIKATKAYQDYCAKKEST